MPEAGTLIAFALIGGLAAWIASLHLRDARAYRAGRGDERYAWLRRSHPEHPALPPAPPKRILRALPERWGRRHAAVIAAQALAIGTGMWLSFLAEPQPAQPPPPQAYAAALFGWVCLMAFATAVLTRLWDLASATLARRRS